MGHSGDGEERKLREEQSWRRWWTGGLGSWGQRRRIGEALMAGVKEGIGGGGQDAPEASGR